MSARYVVLCPDSRGPSGGVAVLYDMVAILRRAGHTVVLAHMSPSGRYANTPHTIEATYTHAIEKARLRSRASPIRFFGEAKLFVETLRGGPNSRLELSPDDVLVVPDFLIAEAASAFPRQRKILFIQNSFALLQTCALAQQRGLDPRARVLGAIGISDTCIEALSLLEFESVFRCPVAPNLSLFPYTETKKPKICYMPRKRLLDARIVIDALRRRGRLERYELVEIDQMPQSDVARIMRESLIFMSFMKTEALGFPAMEAMSAGCIVIGFTGLGTEEYFTPETGIPVPEGDLVALVHRVEETVAAYDHDPLPFDEVRARASQMITKCYGGSVFEDSLRATWEVLAAGA